MKNEHGGKRGLSGLAEKLVEQYRWLVMKLAWQYWRKLPVYTKLWVDPDDLIEEAYLFILTTAIRQYDPKRASRTTFVWVGVNSVLLNFALSQQVKKRFGWSVPLEELRFVCKTDERLLLYESEQALNRVYESASPLLKEEMRLWFGPGKPKYHRSIASRGLQEEFKTLAHTYHLVPDDCRRLFGRGIWLAAR